MIKRTVALLGRWLKGTRSKPATGDGKKKLRDLREKAARASTSVRPQYHLEAARLAESLGLEAEALSLYGDAIDEYLETGRGRAAEVVCRQVIESYPHVVRARRTLALIALGRGDAEGSASLLREYAEAAKGSGQEQLTRKSLRAMGLISGPGPVRTRAVAELRAIGDEAGAQMVLEREEDPQDEVFGKDARSWAKALETALLGPDELRNRGPG